MPKSVVKWRKVRSQQKSTPRLLQGLSGQGWASVQLEAGDSASLGRQLLDLASILGTPQPTRGKALVDRLIPQKRDQAPPKSLSASAGLAEQPWHVDLAHCQVPAHYIALACEHEGSSPVPTELAHWKNLLDIADYEAGHAEPFLVRNGRGSFYATMLAREQKFLRYDPGCMQPMTQAAKALMRKLCGKGIDPIVRIDWQPGLAVIIDNWRMLHRRLDAHRAQDRVLLRVSVIGDSKR